MRRRWTIFRLAIPRSAYRSAALSIILIFFAALYVDRALAWPYGDWDAWAIWNTRARFFALAPNFLDGFRLPTYYSHTDYPPLVPLIIGALWRLVGMSRLVPVAVHGAIYLGLLWFFRRSWWALLLIAAVGVNYAPTQCMDTAQALTLLAATVAYFAHRDALAGAALGVGMLVKNEGMLIAVVFVLAWIIWERRIPWRLLVAMLPFSLMLVLYKLNAGSANDVLSSGSITERALTWSRYEYVVPRVVIRAVVFGNYSFVVLAVALWLSDMRFRWSMPLAASGVILVGYIGIYIVTPYDMGWHIGTSWDRLLWQVFPAAVYALMIRPGQSPGRMSAPAEPVAVYSQ